MDYLKLASKYSGRELTLEDVDFAYNGNGVVVKKWNVVGVDEPTILMLESYAKEVEDVEFNKNICKEIEDLDKKRIRAIAEPRIKDTITGQTWIEYYNLQIKELRSQLR